MDNNETVLENELDNIEVTETEAVDEQEVGEDADDEFDYDDEGNIIIPELDTDEFAEVADAEESDDEADDESDADSEDGADDDEPTNSEPEQPEETQEEPDPRDAEIARLRAELDAYKSQGQDTLKNLGSDKSDDVMEGLAAMAAEAQGISLEEYKKKREDELRAQRERTAAINHAFEEKAKTDLAELHAAYPETAKYKHIKDLPDDIRRKFGSFREKGLTAKEAYAAANPDGIRRDTENAVKKQAAHKSKEHLRSSVPKSSKDNSVRMSRAELSQWREIFPDKSDAELEKLYKQTL